MEQASHLSRVVEVDGDTARDPYRTDDHEAIGWFTVEELADRQDVTEKTVFRWLDKGKVKKMFDGESRYRIKEQEPEKPTERPFKKFPLKEHQRRVEEETGEQEEWDFLRGHLNEPSWASREVCPEEIVSQVAKLYAITDKGRLFRLQEGGAIVEREWPSSGQFNLCVDDTRRHPPGRRGLALCVVWPRCAGRRRPRGHRRPEAKRSQIPHLSAANPTPED